MAENTKYFRNRSQWRAWLEKNYKIEKEIWLIYPNKSSGKKCILYNDAVEEALCFGWIDSTIRKIDDDHRMQRFTPRRPKSTYSQPNKERIKWLAERNLIIPEVREKLDEIIKEEYVFPEDILGELKKDSEVWKNYLNFTENYRRLRIAYIDHSRNNPEFFRKRLEYFIKNTRQNKQIRGYGGIEKYY